MPVRERGFLRSLYAGLPSHLANLLANPRGHWRRCRHSCAVVHLARCRRWRRRGGQRRAAAMDVTAVLFDAWVCQGCPHSRIIVNTTWPRILNRWVAAAVDEGKQQRSRAEQRWALCYSSFTDYATSPAVFHRQCDNYTTTLVVARNSLGYTFGGYAVRSWSVDKCCAEQENRCAEPVAPENRNCYDKSATADFTFRLSPGGVQQFLPKSSLDSRYQYLKADIWPAWGVGDLTMGEDGGHIGSGSACCLKRGFYTCTPQKQRGGLCGSGKQAREGHWGHTDMEVWRPL